jgi:hypothetical protein
MSTGEILDRTFSNYRHNFKLFAGIAAVPAAILLVCKLLFILVGVADSWTPAARGTGIAAGGAGSAALIFSVVGAIVTAIFYVIALAVSQGATAYAVSAVHLEVPTTIRECYGRIKGRYGRMVNVIVTIYIRVFGVMLLAYLLIILAVFVPSTFGAKGIVLSVAIGILALVGFFVGLIFAVRLFARYSLAVPACVVEDIKTRPAIKRSVFLSKGSIGKILAIYILVVVINMVAAFGVAIPIQMLMFVSKTTLWATMITIFQAVGSFGVYSVVGPLATIALSLVYFDERVRKEAFDIQYMMQFLPQAPPVEVPAGSTLTAQFATAPAGAAAEPMLGTEQRQPESSASPEQGPSNAEGAGTANS